MRVPTLGQSLHEGNGNMSGSPQLFDSIFGGDIQEHDRQQVDGAWSVGGSILSSPVFGEHGIVEEVADEVTRVSALPDPDSVEFWRDFRVVKQLAAPALKDVVDIDSAFKLLGAASEEAVALVLWEREACNVLVLVVAVATTELFDRVRILVRAHAKVQPDVDLVRVCVIEVRYDCADLIVCDGNVVRVDNDPDGDTTCRRWGEIFRQSRHDRVGEITGAGSIKGLQGFNISDELDGGSFCLPLLLLTLGAAVPALVLALWRKSVVTWSTRPITSTSTPAIRAMTVDANRLHSLQSR